MRIDLDKIKNKKVLGTGMFGTAYLVTIMGVKYVVKIQKILKSDLKKNIKIPLWKELDMFKYIDTLKREESIWFTKLYGYEFIENCKHIQKHFIKLGNNPPKMFLKLQKSNYCIEYVMEYKGMSFADFILTHKLTAKLIYSFSLQLYVMTEILRKGGYLHNDLHYGNVTIQKTDVKYFKYKSIRIPSFGYKLSLIDYGETINNKYKHHRKDFKKYPDMLYYLEYRWCIEDFILNNTKHFMKQKKEGKKMIWENKNFYNKMLFKIYNDHNSFWNKWMSKLIKKFPKAKKHIEELEKAAIDNITDFRLPKNVNILEEKKFFICTNAISTLFYLYHPKLHCKYIGFDYCFLPVLSKKESIELLFLKSKKEIMKYCASKLKIKL